MHCVALFFTCVVVSVASHGGCDYPSFYDGSPEDYHDFNDAPFLPSKPPSSTRKPPKITTQEPKTTIRVTTNTEPPRQHVHVHGTNTPRPIPPGLQTIITDAPPRQHVHVHGTNIPRPSPPGLQTTITDAPPSASIISRFGEDVDDIQQTQLKELKCLEVLDNLIASQWQEDIEKISVRDLGKFSTAIKTPTFSNYYSNPESEWIQEEEGKALEKLDKCVRNIVSKIAPRMNQEEIRCLNQLYPSYLVLENKTAKLMEMYIAESYREQLPFRSFYTYLEMTDVLMDNVNFEALDNELKAVDEDMRDFYIKSEEDKTKKLFIIEQECVWKNSRQLREVRSEDDRYQKFGQLVKSHVNRYLVAAILWDWVPGAIIPEDRYKLWRQARKTMEQEILDKSKDLQRQKRDAQFLCTYAAEFATKFFTDQREILFDKMKKTSLSSRLKTFEKYSYVVALEELLVGKNDNRRFHAQVLVKEFTEGHFCLTNFVRMVENQQRYMLGSALIGEMLPYGITYCHVKEMSAKLVNPRYCKCQGTFCEKFGLATIRPERYQLRLLPNGTYKVTTDPFYRPLVQDDLVDKANNQIAKQKFNTWWWQNQKMPPKLIV